MFYESKRQAEVVMGQIRNTRKIYFLNYNKLRLLLILRMYVYKYIFFSVYLM